VERLTIKEILQKTTDHFKKYGILTPRLDAEVLLADLLDIERIELYVQFDRPLEETEIDEYRERVIQRSKRIPVAYIIARQEFMSLDFKVNENVLIPRAETEHLVESISKKISEIKDNDLTVVELCTGSGAIVISLIKEINELQLNKKIDYIATDISESALEVARENAKTHGVLGQINFQQGDLLKALRGLGSQIDILLSNPPYVSEEEMGDLEPELAYEPDIALKGGRDGLEFYRRIISEGKSLISADGLIALELGNQQVMEVKELLLTNSFSNIEIVEDYSGISRIVLARK
jgi:release factor glutamine methyltransferase